MSLHITSSKRKLHRFPRLAHLRLVTLPILTTLALFITAFPSLAATPQPQPAQSPQAPNATCPPDGQCFADVLSGNSFYAFINRIYQQDLVSGYPCGGFGEPCDPEGRPYYRPIDNVTRQQMAKFIDNARRLPGIHIDTNSISPSIYISNSVGDAIYARTASSNSAALFGIANGSGWAVRGTSPGGGGVLGDGITGVKGTGSAAGYGVWGTNSSSNGSGVRGDNTSGIGVQGISNSGYGVYGVTGNATGNWAGYFEGNVFVSGTCCNAGAGTYKIDDPLDPAHKYLYQSGVESPNMLDMLDGNLTTDGNGEATVQLPPYFEALNTDFRYQLTVIGQFSQAIVSQEIKDNRFSIKTDKPNVKVSWQVTGVRHDPYATKHPIEAEQPKPADEQGKYLHPTELGQPASSGIDYVEQQKMHQALQSKP